MNFNEFEAVIYQPATGGYIPHIKVKDIRNFEWSGPTIDENFPLERNELRAYGIDSNGREMYNTKFPRVCETEAEAIVYLNVYKAILTHLIVTNLK